MHLSSARFATECRRKRSEPWTMGGGTHQSRVAPITTSSMLTPSVPPRSRLVSRPITDHFSRASIRPEWGNSSRIPGRNTGSSGSGRATGEPAPPQADGRSKLARLQDLSDGCPAAGARRGGGSAATRDRNVIIRRFRYTAHRRGNDERGAQSQQPRTLKQDHCLGACFGTILLIDKFCRIETSTRAIPPGSTRRRARVPAADVGFPHHRERHPFPTAP